MPASRQLARRTTKLHEDSHLSEAMLNDELSRMLTVSNDYDNLNLIRFNYHLREYKTITTFDPMTVLIEGSINYKHVEEMPYIQEHTDSPTHEEEAVEESKAENPVTASVKNQFNFCDRGSQTVDGRPRHQLMQTEPPATSTFSASSSQGIIYDAYVNVNKKIEVSTSDPRSTALHPCVNKLADIVDRMIIQNLYDHLLLDFKYYEDPADDVRGHIGCLLPLWKFNSELTEYLTATSVCWSPHYSDLFAVSFATCSYTKEGEGAILLYSMKNPSNPTYTYPTECSVMTVDINPNFSHLLCAGFYDGSVAIYNLGRKMNQPEQQSERGVHNMYISQIKWDRTMKDNQLCCYTISPDGLIVKWSLGNTGLKHLIILTLDISDFIEKSMVEMSMSTFGSGITIAFHPVNTHIYLVGTEMGQAYVCSRTHSTEALQTFDAHHSAVYKIAWNTFHPKIFITCGEDWTVKIWEHATNIRKPLIVFDLGSQVYDVEWAPFSSTVFSAVTANAQVFVYDLAVDKNEPLCEQVVLFLQKTRAMHVKFNKFHPVILVGDDRGEVTCLKLSPNLRKGPKDKKIQVPTEKKEREKFEISRLDDILATVREKYD